MEAGVVNQKNVVRVICVWCGEELGQTWTRGRVPVFHSICPGCLEQIRRSHLAAREAG
ncbi:MAG: hypothetical protein AB1696_18035 [Planctomycetota bacterium]